MSTITVLCNESMLQLLTPIEVSKGVSDESVSWRSPVFAAVYDFNQLTAITEEKIEEADAWWREMGPCNITIEWRPRIIKREGIFTYLCDRYGISTERHIAVALHDLAHNAYKTPIELMNWLAKDGGK